MDEVNKIVTIIREKRILNKHKQWFDQLSNTTDTYSHLVGGFTPEYLYDKILGITTKDIHDNKRFGR